MRRLQLQTASFESSGRFSQQLLRADTDSIRGLYLSNGFRDVQVTSTVEDNYRGKKNNLFVSFHIVEGVQTRVADLRIDGNQAIQQHRFAERDWVDPRTALFGSGGRQRP